jgi:hypothetical protein
VILILKERSYMNASSVSASLVTTVLIVSYNTVSFDVLLYTANRRT